MLIYAIIAIVLIVIAFIIYIEYKNEKTYKKEKEQRKNNRQNNKPTQKIKEEIQTPKPRTTKKKEAEQPKVIIEEKVSNLPKCKYPPFNFERLLGMGLSKEEAIEFAQELIPQIKTQIPLIEEALDKKDFQNMERLTHSIKGSSTTVGTGGISDLLVEFNTYLKSGTELDITNEYLKYLKKYSEDLEKQFS